MNAEEARRLTTEANKGPSIDPVLNLVYQRIKTAATKGERSIVDPFHGTRGTLPSSEQVRAIRVRLEQEGFEWINHPNPDPDDPRGREYIEIKW